MKKVKISRLLAGLLAGAMILTAAGCSGDTSSSNAASTPESGGGSSGETENSNFNESGWPVVNETVTLKVYGSRNSDSPEDWNDYILIQEMEDTTNVHFEFELVESSTYAEKKSVKMTSGDYPDIIKDGLSVTEIVRYAKDGVLIPLEEMQEKYCPNLLEKMDSEYGKMVAVVACTTMPDGHRYTMPTSGIAPWIGLNRIGAINTDWLEAVDMEVPTTLDEFKDVLVAFKTQDPNGNGQADEIPLCWQGAVMGTNGAWDFGLNWLADSFQCPSPQSLMNVKDGKVYFVAATEEYRNFVRWLGELYAEGLMDEQGFSQTGDQYSARLTSETPVAGVVSAWELGDNFATYDAYNHYTYLDPMTGLDGLEPTPYFSPYDTDAGRWAVTSACQYPEVAVRVADYFYEDDMRAFEWMEGRYGDEVNAEEQIRLVPCTECDLEGAYMVADPPEGVNTQTFRNKCCPASSFPYIMPTEAYEKYHHLHYTDQKADKIRAIKASENVDMEVLPTLLYTDEESEIVNQIQSNLITNVNRITAEWVMNGKIDEEWDSYLASLDGMGMNDMLTAMQAAYDRFLEAK